MANFDFLKGIVEYKVFADAAIEAERVFPHHHLCVQLVVVRH